MREGNGVLIIEVKDWNLNNFTLNEKKQWVLIRDGSVVKSPINQVLKYKNNLFDLHVDKLLEKKINDIRHFRIVSCAIYFHCASQRDVEDLLVSPFKEERKYQDFRGCIPFALSKAQRFLKVNQSSFLYRNYRAHK